MSVNNTQIQPTINEETQILIGGLKNNVARINNLYKDMLQTNNIHKVELVENWIETAKYIPKLAKILIWKYIVKHPYNIRVKSSLLNRKSKVEEVKIEKTDKKGKIYYEIGYIHYNHTGHRLCDDDFIIYQTRYRDLYDGYITLYKNKEPQEYFEYIKLNKKLFDIDIEALKSYQTELIRTKYKWLYIDIFTPKDNFKEVYDEYQQTLEDERRIAEEDEEKTAE